LQININPATTQQAATSSHRPALRQAAMSIWVQTAQPASANLQQTLVLSLPINAGGEDDILITVGNGLDSLGARVDELFPSLSGIPHTQDQYVHGTGLE
jgi:hypothetical protein